MASVLIRSLNPGKLYNIIKYVEGSSFTAEIMLIISKPPSSAGGGNWEDFLYLSQKVKMVRN